MQETDLLTVDNLEFRTTESVRNEYKQSTKGKQGDKGINNFATKGDFRLPFIPAFWLPLATIKLHTFW